MNAHPAGLLINEAVAAIPVTADLLHASGRVLFDSVCSSLLMVSPSGQISFANESAEAMVGCSSADLAGVEFGSIFQAEEHFMPIPTAWQASTGTLIPPRAKQQKGTLLCHNGAKLPVRVYVRTLHDNTGGTIGDVVTIEDLSDYVQMSEYVQLMAHHDLQTGLPKLETLLTEVDAAILQLYGAGMSFAFAEIGIDHFRRINESLGHAAGDRVLREIGKRLAANLGCNDSLTRSAGDGFAVLFTECATQEEAMRRAADLLRTFEEPFQVNDYCVRITASLGVTFGSNGQVTRNAVLTEAELALRRSKSLGGNQIACFDPTMADWRTKAVQLETKMQSALQREEFFVVYQPQICLKSGKLTGVEALLRWNSATDGLVMPNSFIPVAEETGLIVQLGEWCLRTACREVVDLQKRLGYSITLAVNVSPKQAREKAFLGVVQSALDESGLDPKCLEIEITEGLLISNEDDALRMIANLQELGVSVAMDDFGMGFSNLGYITRFKVDRLKIDRSFVNRCTNDRNSKMITTSILFLAKSLGIEVVAEGVETDEQATMLASLECDMAQGYLYSRPTTSDQIFKQARQFAPPQPAPVKTTGPEAGSPSWISRMRLTVEPLQAVTSAGVETAILSRAPKKVAPSTSIPKNPLNYLEPREPICRPARPAWRPGAARVRVQAVDEETELSLHPKAYEGPRFGLLS